MKQIQVLILAAGQGKRMGGGDLPKVLQPIFLKPMISWLAESIKKSGVDPNPAIVVGHGAEIVRRTLGGKYIYIHQTEPLGTAHAVMQARPALEERAENVMVIYGDHPFLSADLIKRLAETHLRAGRVLTMATTTVPDFLDWRKPFYDFGRVIRDESGKFKRSVELKDATPEEREIKELNPSLCCFRASWLWANLPKIENKNAQGEYYLPDLLEMAVSEGQEIATVPIDPKECLGVNSKEQLELVEELFRSDLTRQ